MHNNTRSNLTAFLLMVAMFLLMMGSIRDDVPVVDEVPHIGAGYSYLVKHDYRMNPEHPPLIKDLAAFPLLFLHLNEPFNTRYWQDDPHGIIYGSNQWYLGRELLFGQGNDPQKIMFWMRLPMILLTVLLGFFIFRWSRELFGNGAALLTLVFYAFSPTFLAHGRFVTTDLGATFGIFASMYYFWHFLRRPSGRNVFWAGIFFGLAQLTKFSAVLLIPFYIVTSIIWIMVRLGQKPPLDSKFNFAAKIILGLIFVGVIGIGLVVWPVYLYHVKEMPSGYQLEEAKVILSSFSDKSLAGLDLWLVSKPYLNALGHYFLGVLMVIQRAAGGGPSYFLGAVSDHAHWYYFPIVYLLKETLALHILTLFAIALGLYYLRRLFKRNPGNSFPPAIEALYRNYPSFLMLAFILFYWIYSMSGNLVIGIRHILPTFPFIYILVMGAITKFIKKEQGDDAPAIAENAKKRREDRIDFAKKIALAFLACWAVISVARQYPYFPAYFNESIGGPANGYRYVVDSNVDWGQDLKRLADFVKKNKIDKIKLDYFGWSDPAYYMPDRYESFAHSDPNQKGWIAVSAQFLQTACLEGKSSCDFDERTYHWLDQYEPVAKIGYSIFVYNLK